MAQKQDPQLQGRQVLHFLIPSPPLSSPNYAAYQVKSKSLGH